VFVSLGIASVGQIAEALSMSREDLLKTWETLPLGDGEIAARMGATRQQVVNFRRSARERIQRHLKALGPKV
jgi:hypothetical protein